MRLSDIADRHAYNDLHAIAIANGNPAANANAGAYINSGANAKARRYGNCYRCDGDYSLDLGKRVMESIHFSSKRNDWETPKWVIDKLKERFEITYDVACTTENCVCNSGIYFNQGRDGLNEKWSEYGYNFCNPPYGREISKWVEKAYREYNERKIKTIMLIPSRTDTKYWHEYIFGKAKIEFLKGRLKFSNCKNSAPFPSALIIYD